MNSRVDEDSSAVAEHATERHEGGRHFADTYVFPVQLIRKVFILSMYRLVVTVHGSSLLPSNPDIQRRSSSVEVTVEGESCCSYIKHYQQKQGHPALATQESGGDC